MAATGTAFQFPQKILEIVHIKYTRQGIKNDASALNDALQYRIMPGRIVVMNSLRSKFFAFFNTPVLLMVFYLVYFQLPGYVPATLIITGIWAAIMLVVNKVEIYSDSVVIEPWLSVLLHLGLRQRIEKARIKNIGYAPGAKYTGEMTIKYDNKEAYVGMTENGATDLPFIKNRVKK